MDSRPLENEPSICEPTSRLPSMMAKRLMNERLELDGVKLLEENDGPSTLKSTTQLHCEDGSRHTDFYCSQG